MIKKRLDLFVKEKYPNLSRNQIQTFITEEQVKVDGQIIKKPGILISFEAIIELVLTQPTYVSRAGFKLEAALKQLALDVHGLVVLDAGISTGGFTDCLLQHGAKKVYGVDVGTDQVHEKMRNDERVTLIETNLKYLRARGEHVEPFEREDTVAYLPELVDLATLDLSFISLLKVMDAVIPLLKPEGKIIALIKPQFELARHFIGRKGIVKDEKLHKQVVEKIKSGMEGFGFSCVSLIESPMLGSSGNKEFLGLFIKK
jgi:23S rRNA (cytidine1920-2'-O)/16S rRNA (cytidine1409-2'-O)-methyltransferase